MAAEGGPTRALRVAEGIHRELAVLLATEIKDPGAAGAVVTRVEVTADLRSARVHVRHIEGDGHAVASEAGRRELLRALDRASGLLRREVTRRLGLRFAPELRFSFDAGPEDRSRVERLLAEIASERGEKSKG